jgi:hypothetical protein
VRGGRTWELEVGGLFGLDEIQQDIGEPRLALGLQQTCMLA